MTKGEKQLAKDLVAALGEMLTLYGQYSWSEREEVALRHRVRRLMARARRAGR